jgi:hypothetical protein
LPQFNNTLPPPKSEFVNSRSQTRLQQKNNLYVIATPSVATTYRRACRWKHLFFVYGPVSSRDLLRKSHTYSVPSGR